MLHSRKRLRVPNMHESSAATTILLVDDTPAALEVLRGALEPEGYTLHMAASGEEALTAAATHRPDLVLLDVMMPGIDGFEVCRRLRSDADLRDVPVVMVTALGDRASRLRGLEAGADDFLTKPVDRLELRLRARTITRLSRYRRMLEARVTAQLADAERREAAQQARAGLAHDAGNHLAAIRAGLDLLAPAVAADADRHNTLEAMRQHAGEALALVGEWSQAEDGSDTGSGTDTPVDLGALLASEAPMWRLVTGAAHVALDASASCCVRVSPRVVHRVVINLLRNAVQADARHVTVRVESDGSQVLLAVRDDGRGMEADRAARAFEPRTSTRQAGSGRGLGLVTVAALVRHTGGDVALDTAPGAGTTVRVRWPRAS